MLGDKNKDSIFTRPEYTEFEEVSRVDYSSLQLSLYFFLLIFFVLLNYLNPYVAKDVAKKEPKEFYIPKDFLITNKANQQIISQVSNYYQNKLLSITPEGFGTVTDYLDVVLQIKSDSALFFQDKAATLDVAEKLFLTNLAQILNLSVQNYTLSIVIELGVKDITINSKELALNLERISYVAEYLLDNQVAQDRITTKISPHANDVLLLSLQLSK
jgi:hypothetical protein